MAVHGVKKSHEATEVLYPSTDATAPCPRTGWPRRRGPRAPTGWCATS